MRKLLENHYVDGDVAEHAEEFERMSFAIRTVERPSVWAETRFILPAEGYGEYGQMTFAGREWQREIMDAFLYYHVVITVGAVQVGKSVAGIDVPWAWFQDQIGGRALLVYADKDTVNDVFEEKLKPIIENNLKHLWSGRDTDIRQDKIILRSGISRCASCNVKNDLATFPAKFVLCDEVAKWKKGTKQSFDAVGQAIGRTRDYHGSSGIDYRISIVSSPIEYGDALYQQIYMPGTLVLKRKVPCLGCGFYHELCVENIHELPNEKGEKDHDPLRIRTEKAAVYICPSCGKVIEDNERYEMDRRGLWATDEEKITPEGTILNKDPLREQADRVCFWMPGRLISKPEKYPFYECLASYFQAKFSPDPKVWQNYWNEDLARFFKPQANRLTEGYLRAKIADNYSMTGTVPEGVLVALGGIDTQDTGFFYTIVGYGRYMESWVLRYGWIPCDMNMSEFKDLQKVVERFEQYFYAAPLKYADGRTLPVLMALMDEGGHREPHVRAICRAHREIVPYKGSGRDSDLFRRSQSKNLYLCNTESLSKLVEKDMGSDTWHLPCDVTQDFLDQIQRQYTKEDKDKSGNTIYVWVHGGEDHYRDCLNYALACAYILELPGRLNNEQGIRQIQNTVQARVNKHMVGQNNETQSGEAQEIKQNQVMHSQTRSYNPFTNRPRIGIWRGR